jgi:hypothetical protein
LNNEEVATSQAKRETYLQELDRLKQLERPISSRLEEYQKRPTLIKELKDILDLAAIFADEFLINITDLNPDDHLDGDFNRFLEFCHATTSWLEQKEMAQQQLLPNQDPILSVSDLENKLLRIQLEMRLMKSKSRSSASAKKSPQNVTKDSVSTNETSTITQSSSEPTTIEANQPEHTQDSSNTSLPLNQQEEISDESSLDQQPSEVLSQQDAIHPHEDL